MTNQPIHKGHRSCDQCAIRHRALCGALKDDELKKLSMIGRTRTYSAGETILADGEPTTFFGNIVSGVVKLEKTSADGRQLIVGLLFPPDFLGRAFSKSNPYYAQAATPVELCVFPNQGFEALLREYSDLERRLFENTLNELDAAREWMFVLGRKSAQEKIASFLSHIARRQPLIGCAHSVPDSAGARFDLPLTRADIADYLGLTIETVSRQLTNLKRKGVIELPGGRSVLVPDTAQLSALAGDDGEAVA